MHQFARVGSQVMIGGAHRRARRCHSRTASPTASLAHLVGPQHRRHEAPQVHPRAPRDGAVVLSKAVSRRRRVRRTPGRGAASGGRGSCDRGNSRLSSTTESIARCVSRCEGRQRLPSMQRVAGGDHDNEASQILIARRHDRGRRRHAVRGRGLADRARHQSRPVRAEGRLRSGAGGALSPSLDFGRSGRPGGEAVSQRELPRSGFHRHAGAAGAVGDPAGLGHAPRSWPRCGRLSAAATIICCPASAAFSNRTVSGWSGSRTSPRIC